MTLVDTQSVIWVTTNGRHLSPAAKTALTTGRLLGNLAIADITLREVAFLVTRGRVLINQPLDVYLRFLHANFIVLPITPEIAERSMGFGPAYPNDPADMLIGATAIVHQALLVTSDRKIRESGEVKCVW